MRIHELYTVEEAVAGPEKCWPGYRKVGTKPGTGKNAGKRVNDCEKIKEEQGVSAVREFAPDDSGDSGDDGFGEETLRHMAAQWYNGDEDPRIERALAAAGWEIGQDEGYDDEPGVFVVRAGDVNGNSYLSWSADELRQGVAENQRNFNNVNDDDLYAVDPETKEIIAHLGNPYNNRTAVLIKKRRHEEQGHEVMSGMRAKFNRDVNEQGVSEGESQTVEVVISDGTHRQRRRVRVSPNTRNVEAAVLKYYAKVGLPVVSINGRPVRGTA